MIHRGVEIAKEVNASGIGKKRRHLADDGSCCNTAAEQGAWKQVVAYHDECDYDMVPEYIEVGFHDYEQSCENYFCNAVGPEYAGNVCPSPPPPPAAGDDDSLDTGAIAGIAVACAVAALAILLLIFLIMKEKAGSPVFTKMDVSQNAGKKQAEVAA